MKSREFIMHYHCKLDASNLNRNNSFMAIFKGFATIVKYLRETIGEGIAAYCVSYTLMRSFVLLYKQFTLYKQKV